MSSSSTAAQKKNEKSHQDFLQHVLTAILKEEDNKYCADCEAKGPRWASWNIGIFLCIRCAGMHRNLGVHISRVRSINLDTWVDDQVSILQQMGNRRAKLIYEALLPENFRRPQTDYALEQFIRAKYEHKRYVDRSINFETPKPKPLETSISNHAADDHQQRNRSAHPQQHGASLLQSPPQSGVSHRTTPPPSSLSPPIAQKAQTVVQKPSGDLFDLFDSPATGTNGGSSNISAGMASIQLTPVGPPSGEKPSGGVHHASIPHSATQSAFDDLSFLSPSQPQQLDSSHPQQHHQRSVSNYDLMSLMNPGQQTAPATTTGAPAAAVPSSSGLDDILSLYKQAPVNPPPMAMGGFGAPQQHQQQNFFASPPMVGGGHHQRNFSDAMAPMQGMFSASAVAAAPSPGQFAAPNNGFGAFPAYPMQQQQQQMPVMQQQMPSFGQQQSAFGMPPNGGFNMQGGFQTAQPMNSAKPPPSAPMTSAFGGVAAVATPATTLTPQQRDDNAFDAIWQ